VQQHDAAVPLPTRAPSSWVPSAAAKRSTTALTAGGPQRLLGCARDATAVLVVGAGPPVPELPEQAAASNATASASP
jgi:hypothetical protein